MKARLTSTAAVLMALGAAWLAPPASLALSTRQLNMADMVRQSAEIVAGTVTGVGQGFDERGLPYTEVTLAVAETIRGSAGATLVFRQFGLQTPIAAAEGRKYLGVVAGMPRYATGEQVVLFLTQPSPIGFRTTIGLEQGRFKLRGGNFENGVDNAGLFRNVDFSKGSLSPKERQMVATQQGAVGADSFLALLRRSVQERWWTTLAIRPLKPGTRIVGATGGGQ